MSEQDFASRRSASDQAMAIYHAALDAVRADLLVTRAAARTGDLLVFDGHEYDLTRFKHIWVVGAGKASAPMATAIEQILGDRLSAGLVVTKGGHALPTRRIEVLEAAHPVPDTRSLESGRRIYELASRATEEDLIICLLSGGASALMELPEPGISLGDLQTATSLLLRSGAPIEELNCVRACLSRIKAGGLARAAAPATLVCLVVSDVLGNRLRVIGSGPCVETPCDRAAAIAIVESRGLIDTMPQAVLDRLRLPEGNEQNAIAPVQHVIIGDIWTALNAARDAAAARGLKPILLTGWLEGEAREVGRIFGGIARELPMNRLPAGVDCYIAGGETTVTVRGSGKGGRSQELAAAAALAMEGAANVALLAAGTDGTDGPTDAAGALVTGATASGAKEAGHDLAAGLRDNNTYPALASVSALVLTGPTLTNVGDLVIIVASP